MLPLEVLQMDAAGDSHCAQGRPSVQDLAENNALPSLHLLFTVSGDSQKLIGASDGCLSISGMRFIFLGFEDQLHQSVGMKG